MVKNVAIFASGSGSNAENICKYFKNSSDIAVVLIGTNNENADVVKRAKNLEIPLFVFTKSELENFSELQSVLEKSKVDFIVLAGFLLKIPEKMVEIYPDKIVNIHPALLPKYGGKGMYGMYVHEAVIAANKSVSGITIHVVDKKYDEGKTVFQAETNITKEDTAQSLANKIHELEQKHFPQVIKEYLVSELG